MIRIEDGSTPYEAKVTFIVAADRVRPPVVVLGDFNDWNPTAHPLTRWRATYRVTVTVDTGRRHAFRYLTAQGSFNDEGADGYQPNVFGGADSVLDLSHPPSTKPPPAGSIPAAMRTVAPASSGPPPARADDPALSTQAGPRKRPGLSPAGATTRARADHGRHRRVSPGELLLSVGLAEDDRVTVG